ncbi:MAG: hypothetical protein ACC656_04820 [Candidatus Heimdallarchaeota archaeon]
MAQQDLFNLDPDSTLDVFEPKKRSEDGLYRPDVKDGDPDKGYVAKIRFLPNFSRKETVGDSAMEKLTHYVKIEGHDQINGALDCNKNFGENCPICNLYWKLKNSRSVIDQEKANLINRSISYYSYILILEDPQHPEYEGKIMIFQYGVKIANKIKEEKMGMYGKKCNVFDLAEGKDFLLVVKKLGEWNNYDSSKFLEFTPLTIKSKDGKLKVMPTEESNGRLVIATKAREKVKEFLLKRDFDLDKFSAKKWIEDDHQRATRVVQVLAGVNNELESASESIQTASSKTTSVPETVGVEVETTTSNADDSEIDDFFDDL